MTGMGRLEFIDGRVIEGKISYYGGLQPLVSVHTPSEEVPYYPELIRKFQLFDREYTVVGNFDVTMGGLIKLPFTINRDFAQVVETGSLELLIHQAYTMGEFMNPRGGTTYQPLQKSSYLLRKQGEFAPIAVFDMTGKRDKDLRNALMVHLASRPDLIQKLKDKSISSENLPACIHAYNTGQPL